MICMNSQNHFCGVVTKYLLDWGINVCAQHLLTPAVVLVFRGVRLGVWTAPPRLCVLWAHWRPLLLAGGTTQNNTHHWMFKTSQQTRSGHVLSSGTQSRVSSHFLNLIHIHPNSIAGPRSVSRNNSVLLFLTQPCPISQTAAQNTDQPCANFSVKVGLTDEVFTQGGRSGLDLSRSKFRDLVTIIRCWVHFFWKANSTVSPVKIRLYVS